MKDSKDLEVLEAVRTQLVRVSIDWIRLVETYQGYLESPKRLLSLRERLFRRDARELRRRRLREVERVVVEGGTQGLLVYQHTLGFLLEALERLEERGRAVGESRQTVKHVIDYYERSIRAYCSEVELLKLSPVTLVNILTISMEQVDLALKGVREAYV